MIYDRQAVKYIKITFILLLSVIAACDAGAIQQFTHLPYGQVEEILLKKIKGATRNGKMLELRTTAGTVAFEDRINVGEASAKYYLIGVREIHDYFYLIRVMGHESRGYVLVNKTTGQTIDLYGMPTFSPDGKRIVDVSLDLESGYMPNLIIIYKLEDSKYHREWEYNYQGLKGPANPVWLNNSAIVFFEVTFDKVPSISNIRKKPFIIECEHNKWNAPRPLN